MDDRWKDEEAHWFVLRTQTKREHIASKILEGTEGVEVFCPRIKYKKATRRGKIWWVEPLFPGYTFAKFLFPVSSRLVTASHGIYSILSFGGKTPHLSNAEIENFRKQAEEHSEDSIITFSPTVEEGDEVEISEGPFKGISGTVTEPLAANDRIKILIEFLGNEQEVELDLYTLLLPRRPTSDNLNTEA